MDAKAPQAETSSGRLSAALAARTATVGICGMGYVGLPLAMAAWEAGFPVMAFDIDPEKITRLAAGDPYLKHIAPATLKAMAGDRRFTPTGDFDRLAECDVITICVPTPLGAPRRAGPELSWKRPPRRSASGCGPASSSSWNSTTYPGTTAEIVAPALASNGLTPGTDYFIAYSPEREDPGNRDFTTKTVPKVVGGDG